jgi:hypothetical protein
MLQVKDLLNTDCSATVAFFLDICEYHESIILPCAFIQSLLKVFRQ